MEEVTCICCEKKVKNVYYDPSCDWFVCWDCHGEISSGNTDSNWEELTED